MGKDYGMPELPDVEGFRHGKWLKVRTDGPTVLVHFGMTGALRWTSTPPDADGRQEAHDRVVFQR